MKLRKGSYYVFMALCGWIAGIALAFHGNSLSWLLVALCLILALASVKWVGKT